MAMCLEFLDRLHLLTIKGIDDVEIRSNVHYQPNKRAVDRL